VPSSSNNQTPTLVTLASFKGANGANPGAGLIADAAGDLFGTTFYGGASNDGTVFELTKTSSGYAAPRVLVFFNGANGFYPQAGLIADAAGDLFGTALHGGASGDGTVFELAKTSSGYAALTVLASFNGTSGAYPLGGLIADAAGDLFGTTTNGGAYSDGTVFELAKTSSGYAAPTVLASFNGTNGAAPSGALIADTAGDLFGTTEFGGVYGDGTVFELTKTNAGYAASTVLVSFNGFNGATPDAGLIADAAGDLFGTTQGGGAGGFGTVFELAKTSSGYAAPTVLASFNGTNGANPTAGLIADAAGDLFGTTYTGGASDDGTVFELTKTYAGYAAPTVLASFKGTNGLNPFGGLIADAAGDLFGTTESGEGGYGTVFEITQSGFQTVAAPIITLVTETPSTGDLGIGRIGSEVVITLTTSEPLIATGGFGTTLSLNDGGIATYDAANSTASSFVFDYTVEAGQYTPSLAVTAVNLNGVTATDAAGTPVNTSLAGLTQVGPQIDTIVPTIVSVIETPATGDLGIGSKIAITLTTNKPLIASGGFGTTLSLNDGGTATYDAAKSTASSFVFDYTVEAGQYTPSLAVTAVNLNGVTATDAFGHPVNTSLAGLTQAGPQIDTIAPTPTLVTLASFNGANGAYPLGGLIADAAGDFFGTTTNGGASNDGTVFELAKTSSGYAPPTVLASFNGANGLNPEAGLIADAAGDLFGTTYTGGASNEGTVFELTKTNSGYAALTVLASFNGNNGGLSNGGLIVDAAGDLFGTAAKGPHDYGTVFELAKTSSGYAAPTVLALLDGGTPIGGLLADAAGDLFGTRPGGSRLEAGMVFEVAKTSSGYAAPTVLASFNGPYGTYVNGELIADAAGDLFGTTGAGGGAYGDGTVFELAKTSSGYAAPTVLASFNGTNGADPSGGLIADAVGDLFGATEGGGAGGYGTVFELAKTSSGYAAPKVLASFNGANGEDSQNRLIADAAGDLFGTTNNGGASNGGTVFEITQSGFQIAPTITAVTETPATGDLGIGGAVAISLKISEPLIASGGFGTTLSLNDGGTATYDAANSTASSFVFDYTVGVGQNTPSLAVTAVNLNGVTATDAAGNAVNLSLAGLTQAGPQIDTGEWTVSGSENLEIPSAFAKTATFAPGAAGTLTLDQSTLFSGQIAGLTAQDTLDLRDIAFGSPTPLGYLANPTNTGGALSVSDGTHLATIALLGNYMASSFVAASDGHGGTLITDPSTTQHAVLALPHAG
jgi:uncharacterized repeat protein (TIGR03803 family)